jgi:nucleoside-diphosphate-sugar epimerase
MKIHVTGAKGFIGAALVPALQRAGHVVAADGAGCDAIVHLAAIAHRKASPAELEEVNVRLAERMGEAAVREGAQLIFLSSVKVHGEISAAALRETSPIVPADRYAVSKARAEERLRALRGLRLTILRPPLVYGPGVKANFRALMQAVARGWPLPLAALQNRRSLVYVGNLADAIARCLNVPGTFLVSDGEAIATAQLCRDLGVALGRPARLFAFPPALLPRKLAGSLEVDDSAIRRTLGWKPPYSRHIGLKATADWYLSR